MGGGGATPHGIYNCQEPPKSLPEQPKRRPNVARAAAGAAGVARAAAGRKGAELCPQPLARGRAGGSSWQQFCLWRASLVVILLVGSFFGRNSVCTGGPGRNAVVVSLLSRNSASGEPP